MNFSKLRIMLLKNNGNVTTIDNTLYAGTGSDTAHGTDEPHSTVPRSHAGTGSDTAHGADQSEEPDPLEKTGER